MKRGFKLQREAKEWERIFLEQYAKNPDISFLATYEKYKNFIKPRIRSTSYNTYIKIIDTHILPYFKNRILSEITASDITEWQNEILQKNLSDSYMHTINTYLSSIFNYAVDYLGLLKNPCKKHIGSSKNRQVDFWTPEEYKKFIEACRDNIEYFTIFEILYYTGMRKGELLALTINDINFDKNLISINKTYYQTTGGAVINPPKTDSGKRVIDIPEFLTEEIKEYISHLYKPEPDNRLFERGEKYLRTAMKKTAEKAGVKKIRIHDIRHSHASSLIDLGANPVLIASRLGHDSPDVTLKIYSHMFPSSQTDIVNRLEKIK